MSLIALAALVIVGSPEQLVDSLPEPTGPHPVGTQLFHLVDSTRNTPVGDPHRPITAQIWYPASPTGHVMPRASYMMEPRIHTVLMDGYYEQAAEDLAKWNQLRLAAIVDAPTKTDIVPLILFSPGLGVVRANYSLLAQELASHGYAVVTIDHPYGAVMETADGQVLRSGEDTTFVDDEAHVIRYEREWAQDILFVRAWAILQSGSAGFPRIDAARTAAVGHSMGGSAAFEACRLSGGMQACVNLDGFSFGLARDRGVNAPALFVKAVPRYSDEDLARLGRTRAQWETMATEIRPALEAPLRQASSRPAYYVEVHGVGHMSFSDAPYVMPSTITRFGGDILTADRTRVVTSHILLTFLGAYLLGDTSSAMTDLSSTFSEVVVQRF